MKRRVLIYGSSRHTPQMIEAAERAVWRVLHMESSGWSIIVGDGYGIDQAVIRKCKQLGVPYTCVGINKRPRNQAGHYHRFALVGQPTTYAAAAAHMVDLADSVVCLWNTFLPDWETYSVYRYAKLYQSKEVILQEFYGHERTSITRHAGNSVADARPRTLPSTGLAHHRTDYSLYPAAR